jgi:hypothetical protein
MTCQWVPRVSGRRGGSAQLRQGHLGLSPSRIRVTSSKMANLLLRVQRDAKYVSAFVRATPTVWHNHLANPSFWQNQKKLLQQLGKTTWHFGEFGKSGASRRKFARSWALGIGLFGAVKSPPARANRAAYSFPARAKSQVGLSISSRTHPFPRPSCRAAAARGEGPTPALQGEKDRRRLNRGRLVARGRLDRRRLL